MMNVTNTVRHTVCTTLGGCTTDNTQ